MGGVGVGVDSLYLGTKFYIDWVLFHLVYQVILLVNYPVLLWSPFILSASKSTSSLYKFRARPASYRLTCKIAWLANWVISCSFYYFLMIHCDNLAAVFIINKGSAAHPLSMHALRLLLWLSAIYNFRFTAVYVHCHFNTIVSAVSCLHEPTAVAKCVAFYHHLQEMQPCHLLTALHWLSILPYAVAISFFPGSKDPQLAQQLQEEIYQYHFHTSAEGTKASCRTHRTSYGFVRI